MTYTKKWALALTINAWLWYVGYEILLFISHHVARR